MSRSESFTNFHSDDDSWMSDDDTVDEEEVAHALSPVSSYAELQAHGIAPTHASQQTVGSSPSHPSPRTNSEALRQPDKDVMDEEEVARVLSPVSSHADSQLHDVVPHPPQTHPLPQTNSQALRRSQTFPTQSTTLQLQPEPADEFPTRSSSSVAGPSTGREEGESTRRQGGRKRKPTNCYPRETYVSTQPLHRSQTFPTQSTTLQLQPEPAEEIPTRPSSPIAGPLTGVAKGVAAGEQSSSKRKRTNPLLNRSASRPLSNRGSQRKEQMYNCAVDSNRALLRHNELLQGVNETLMRESESMRKEGMALYNHVNNKTQQLQEKTMALHTANTRL